jgi:N-acyl-L-homoserine lactone synthetase
MDTLLTKIYFFFYYLFNKRFLHEFEFYLAESQEDLEEIQRLRYEVYCEEYHYIDPLKFNNKKEIDDYDPHAKNFILRDKKGDFVGTVRLISDSQTGFPIEKHFKLNFDPFSLERDKLVEISRLIVSREYRRRHLLLLLVRGMYIFAKQNNVLYAYCVMDDRLFNLLIKLGFRFKKIGGPTIYQGITCPYLLEVAELEESLKENNPVIFNFLKEGFNNHNHQGKFAIH